MQFSSFAVIVVLAVPALSQTASAYYHPRLGRFMQRDPAGYTAIVSLYDYLLSNPIDLQDPEGLVCTLAIRCTTVERSGQNLGTHCGIVILNGPGSATVWDGSGGDTNVFAPSPRRVRGTSLLKTSDFVAPDHLRLCNLIHRTPSR